MIYKNESKAINFVTLIVLCHPSIFNTFFFLFLSLLTSHLTITLKTTFLSHFYLSIFPLLFNFSVTLPQFFCLPFTINMLFSLTFNLYFSHIKKKVITLFLSIFIFLLVDFLILCFISTIL